MKYTIFIDRCKCVRIGGLFGVDIFSPIIVSTALFWKEPDSPICVKSKSLIKNAYLI